MSVEWSSLCFCWKLKPAWWSWFVFNDKIEANNDFTTVQPSIINVIWHKHNSVSNNWEWDDLFNSFFRLTTKKTKLHIIGQFYGNSWVIPKGSLIRKVFLCHDVIMLCQLIDWLPRVQYRFMCPSGSIETLYEANCSKRGDYLIFKLAFSPQTTTPRHPTPPHPLKTLTPLLIKYLS